MMLKRILIATGAVLLVGCANPTPPPPPRPTPTPSPEEIAREKRMDAIMAAKEKKETAEAQSYVQEQRDAAEARAAFSDLRGSTYEAQQPARAGFVGTGGRYASSGRSVRRAEDGVAKTQHVRGHFRNGKWVDGYDRRPARR